MALTYASLRVQHRKKSAGPPAMTEVASSGANIRRATSESATAGRTSSTSTPSPRPRPSPRGPASARRRSCTPPPAAAGAGGRLRQVPDRALRIVQSCPEQHVQALHDSPRGAFFEQRGVVLQVTADAVVQDVELE